MPDLRSLSIAAALTWALAPACGRVPDDLCAADSPEVQALCTLDRVVESVYGGRGAEAAEECDVLPQGTWRDECRFQVAEALAMRGELNPALSICGEIGRFAQMCFGHALWLRSTELVDATPADADAWERVDAFIATLPDIGLQGAHLTEIARAAAWHGIYAGSGSADPAAARAAPGRHARHARTAFAWEAVRLQGNQGRSRDIVEYVQAVWDGREPPPSGAPLPLACWRVRLVPRMDLLSPLYTGTIRTYGGGIRFTDPDPDTDLRIATLSAIWTHGRPIDALYLAELARDPSPAVQLTAATLMGADTGGYRQPESFFTEHSPAWKLARATRKAAQRNNVPTPYTPRTDESCP
ncbi:MAG: hypothetical protein D6798_01885 [Deltaproteobacteria bacterium]|nr:MAG: hypothetical protein D6798_01885 [Deltaproteobacteria bacterium]